MDQKTQGAWIIHHKEKLQRTTNQDFDSIAFAGKCGTLLSALSSNTQVQIPQPKLEALARANGISPRGELPAIVSELARQRLILPGAGAVEVLGLTSTAVLEHTSTIYEESGKQQTEDAVLNLAELTSELPLTDLKAQEFISDTYRLAAAEAAETIALGSSIGFFDSEKVSANEKLLFNGNLFRKEEAKKVNAVVNSLKPSEASLLREVNEMLNKTGCMPVEKVKRQLGGVLFDKLHSIGMFDVNAVGNEHGKHYFVTRPAAFSKFTNSIADDALDLAKAFVASLTYGMTISSYSRGRIQMVTALMKKLIAGGTVGPATAIGSDYQALELKGVVEVKPAQGGMFTMRLLKPEVGMLALAVIEEGDITSQALASLPGAQITEYQSPEATREVLRKNSSEEVKTSARNLLNEIRTGGL